MLSFSENDLNSVKTEKYVVLFYSKKSYVFLWKLRFRNLQTCKMQEHKFLCLSFSN